MTRQSPEPEPEFLRPAAAAARFHVARQTLAEWADDGLIGRSKVGRLVLYPAADIAELIAANLTRRTVVPVRPAAVGGDWESDEFWQRGAR